MEFEKVKSYLSKHVDDNGTSIYSHLAAISRKIVEEKPENAYQLFENISLEVKHAKLNVDNGDIPKVPVNEQERAEIKANIDSILTSYGRKPQKKIKQSENEDDDQEEEEKEEPIDITKCANILEYQQLLSWSGIFIDNEESFQLQRAFADIVRKNENIENCRFWGKIQAIDHDYYIVESKLSEYPEPPEDKPPKNEDPGKGCNEFVYFVTTNIENAEWIKLNDVTPKQIKKSRAIYRLFTGNLDAKVGGRVHFPWNEAQLLRAHIARISSSTILCPTGYYQKPEEEDEENPFAIELNEEFEPNEDGGISQESWVHQRAHLRIEGRFKKWIEPEKEDEEENDDEEKEEKEPTEEELEEEIAILQGITEDKSSICSKDADEESESSNCWFIRELNKDTPYKIIVINNQLWNGAKTIYVSSTKTFVNIYVGDGVKYRGDYYTPSAPLSIQSQFNEFKEIEVPNEENDEEKEEETITKQVSVFELQPEVMPPPPKEENEENQDDDADKEEEAE